MKRYIIAIGVLTIAFIATVSAQMNQQTLPVNPVTTTGTAVVAEELNKEDDSPNKKTLGAAAEIKKTAGATQTTAVKMSKPMTGQIVDFGALVMGGNGELNKKNAEALVAKGKPIAFKVGNKIYFVFNSDGSFAANNLVRYANNKLVGIIGKTQKVNGLNIIIADKIESMD
ncbi:MAG: hypothetical protein PF588_00465 [Candidatus Kapabacteria bacterium]|nr:hypothetical protein [Candidatus Kapabacteria bacterium]